MPNTTARLVTTPNRKATLLTTLAALCWVLLAGCGRPPVEARQLPSPVISHNAEQLDPALLSEAIGGAEGDAYRVGPGDRLLVAVYGHPDLSFSAYTGTSVQQSQGLTIDNDGTIQFPLIGSVAVAGKSAEELRRFLEQQLALYIKDPRVTVQIAFNGSVRYYLLGQFTDPGVKFSDRPLHLLEALALGGSVELTNASLRTAYLARGKRRLPINFRRLIREGDLTQNIKLQTGDVVLIPDSQNEKAFVFGGAAGSAPQGGPVNFVDGRLTLTQALAGVGMGIRDRYQGDLSDVRVIRSEGAQGEFFIVDAEQILDGDAADFELAPGDVVLVPASGMTTWNEALNQFLPSLQTISGLLTPFVQIKYLTDQQ